MSKNFVFVFVCCLLAVAAFADTRGFSRSGARRNGKADAILNNKEVRGVMNGRRAHFGHPQMQEMRHLKKEMVINNHMHKHHTNKFEKKDIGRKTLVPGETFVDTIQIGSLFSVPFSEGDSIAVQIVRSSDMYDFEDESPVLRRCSIYPRKCVSDNEESLSFELSSDELKKRKLHKDEYDFSLTTFSSRLSGVVVGIYACVGPNASLQTCVANSSVSCVYGKPSDVVDVCVCDKGYTGLNCSEETSVPHWDYDSAFEEFGNAICTFLAIVFNIVFFAVVGVTFVGCCMLCCSCCRHRCQRNGRVVRNPRGVPPPPPYVRAGAYHPLSVVPPPPPPPPMQVDPYYGKGIEMTTLPAARVSNPVFVMPPLAPVNQVPVFVQPPPAPKN